MKNIIIIGSRGYKSKYGGWETFVTNLIDNYNDSNTKFYIPFVSYNKKDKSYVKDNVVSTPIHVLNQGNITMFNFAIKATLYYKKYIKENNLDNVIVYVLGCRVGFLYKILRNSFHKMNVKLMINPDGLEWKRERWPWLVKKYFRMSEHEMITSCDHVVCDSKSIFEYVDQKYKKYNVSKSFIAYGAYLKEVDDKDEQINDFFLNYKLKENNYYLVVARFVEENNFELIINEFMKTNTKKDLVIVSNVRENKFYKNLKEKTRFCCDSRIKFVGAVYDQNILRYLRKNAYAYIHGHSVGGTNPSLLEALSITDLNILYDVSYNKEVGMNAAFYFNKENDNLKELIEKIDFLSVDEKSKYGNLAKKRIKDEYTWDIVVSKYKKLFAEILKNK